MGKHHAEHNENVCQFLDKDGGGKYPDWVVTTAFYSALHFVQHAMFPLDRGQRTFTSFDNYYNGFFNRGQNKPNKHRATIDLVYDELGDEAGEVYEWLHGTCRTARYRSFNTNPIIANLSKERLKELKEYLPK